MKIIQIWLGLLGLSLLLAGGSCSSQNTAMCTVADVAIEAMECGSRPACEGSKRDCKNGASDGCETDVSSDPNNCGGCGIVCSPAAGGDVACVDGKCTLSACAKGALDCNSSMTDGCEVDGARDVNNCGTCGTVCPGGTNGAAACQAGKCTLVCNAGYLDCDGNPDNGCETNGSADTNNCGNCGNVCPSTPNLNAACAAGTCITSSCNAPQRTCKAGPIDGCEVNTSNDVGNCGACGKKCSTPANATPACVASNCAIGMCDSGFADCDKGLGNGCEVDLTSDTNNCGDCGKPCKYPNATPKCSNRTCAMGACSADFADCNKLDTDGCEINIKTDAKNCGMCGKTCASGESCAGGTCQNSCRVVGGVRWCYNPRACGQACNDVCAALGLPFTIDNATWFAAQDTAAECQAINDAFGLGGTVNMGGYTYACLEDSGGTYTLPAVPRGPLFCSTYAGCPGEHRTNMDGLGGACATGSRLSLCPCQ